MKAINSTPIVIRDFDKATDYAARVEIHNATFTDLPLTAEEFRNWDEHDDPDPKYLNRRLVAQVDDQTGAAPAGNVVAFMWYGHRPGLYHPRKLHFNLAVHPKYRRRGVGSRMYERMLEGVAPYEPLQIMSGTFENQREGLSFLEHRGFAEEMRAWESFLDVPSFDPEPYGAVFAKVQARDIEIKSEAELESDPEFKRKLYEMFAQVIVDVPAPDPITPPSFERFWRTRNDEISRIPQASFVAVDRKTGNYAGMSELRKMQAMKFHNTGLTGVRRAYRRMGIALALKLTAIDWARRNGVTRIRTDNESNNRAMLSINEMLGFVRGTAEIALVKRLASESRVADRP